MFKLGYKVVSVDGHNGGKSTHIAYNGVFYRPNEVTSPRPKCGPLCVFATLETANYFRRFSVPETRLYECFYIKSGHCGVWNKTGRWAYGDWIGKEFLPCGTVLADAVMITREV